MSKLNKEALKGLDKYLGTVQDSRNDHKGERLPRIFSTKKVISNTMIDEDNHSRRHFEEVFD